MGSGIGKRHAVPCLLDRHGTNPREHGAESAGKGLRQQSVRDDGIPAAGPHQVKWNPGHYMSSDAVLMAGKTMSYVQGEMDDLNNQDAILGYRVYISWGALEPTMGNYDFSVLDAILARLKTAYNKPKRLVIYLWLYGGSLGQNDGSVLPMYISRVKTMGRVRSRAATAGGVKMPRVNRRDDSRRHCIDPPSWTA